MFLPDEQDEPTWETIQRLIYRADLDAIEEHSSITHPDELNRRPSQLAAVGSFGSVIWGLQDYVENGLVLSAALTISAAATLRRTRIAALDVLHDLHRLQRQDDETPIDAGHDPSVQLAHLQRTIGRLQTALTFGAESTATIEPLLPSLRIESFHEALYQSTGIPLQAALVDRMLTRLNASTSAELAALNEGEAARQRG